MIGISLYFLRLGLFIGMFFLIPWWQVITIWICYFLNRFLFFRFAFGLHVLDSISATYYDKVKDNSSFIMGCCIIDRCEQSVLKALFNKMVSKPGTAHFRKKIIKILGEYQFIDEVNFSVQKHIRNHNVQIVHSIDELVTLMGAEMLVPIEAEKSPWEVIFVEKMMSDKSAFLWKVHHCLGDGVALQYLFTHSADRPPQLMQRFAPKSWSFSIISWILCPFFMLGGALYMNSRSTVNDPLLHRGRQLDGRKSTAYAGPYQIEDIKRVSRHFGTTINNLLLSIVLSAFKSYFKEENGEEVENMNMALPVNCRWKPTQASPLVLNNKFCAFIQKFPLTLINDIEVDSLPICERLVRVTKKLVSPIRTTMLVFSSYISDLWPHKLANVMITSVSNKASVGLTNVAGSRTPIHFQGKLVYDVIYLAPALGANSANVSISSYTNRISIMANADTNRLSNPQKFIAIVEALLDKYLNKLQGGVNLAIPTFSHKRISLHAHPSPIQTQGEKIIAEI